MKTSNNKELGRNRNSGKHQHLKIKRKEFHDLAKGSENEHSL